MNQRRDSSSPSPAMIGIAAGVVLVLVIAAIYWFAIRDDDKKPTVKATGPLAAQTFTAPGNSFSFKYPGNFAQTDPPSDGTVWIAGVGPYDLLRVKRLANKPTSPGRLQSTLSKTLGALPGSAITHQGKESRAGRDVVTFTVTSTVDSKQLTSRLYYFSANGVTWQFECESNAKAGEINAACDQALSSLVAAA